MAAGTLSDKEWEALDALRFSTMTQRCSEMRRSPYSPSLNLIEHLWGHVKRTILANVLFETLDDLIGVFRDGVRRLTSHRDRLTFMFDHDNLTRKTPMQSLPRDFCRST